MYSYFNDWPWTSQEIVSFTMKLVQNTLKITEIPWPTSCSSPAHSNAVPQVRTRDLTRSLTWPTQSIESLSWHTSVNLENWGCRICVCEIVENNTKLIVVLSFSCFFCEILISYWLKLVDWYLGIIIDIIFGYLILLSAILLPTQHTDRLALLEV